MPYGLIILALQVICVIHAAKTGRFWPWGYVVIFLPLFGALAYVLIELLPEWFGGVQGQKARKSVVGTLDPGRRYRQLTDQLDVTDTIANRAALAEECLKLGKYDEAFQIFNTTPLEKSPALLASYTSTALFRLGRNDEASAIVAQFFKDYPNDEGGLVTSVKAMMLAKSGKQREAEETIQRALTIGRGYAHFHHTSYNIASAYALMKEPEQAMKWLRVTADEGFPNYPLFDQDAQLDNREKTRNLSHSWRSRSSSGSISPQRCEPLSGIVFP